MAGEITYGQTRRRLQLPCVTLTETLHRAGLTLPAHQHANANVNFVLSGAFGERVERREYDCRLGSLLVKPGGASHSNHYRTQPAHCLVVEFSPGFHKRLQPGSLGDVWYSEDPRLVGLGWQLYRELVSTDSGSALAVEELVWELVGAAEGERGREESSRSAPRWWRCVREQLDSAIPDFDLAGIAREADVHPRHLMRAFRRYAGCSIGEHLRRRRVRRAQRLLAETHWPIAQVAAETGFYDQSHFTHTFKRLTRLTPREYRHLARG